MKKIPSELTGKIAFLLMSAIMTPIAQAARVSDALSSAPMQVLSVGLWICAAIALIVFGMIVYSVIAFRPVSAPTSGGHARHKARELVWAVVPIAIVVAAATPAMTDSPSTLKNSVATIADSRSDHCITALTASMRPNVVRPLVAAAPCTPGR